MAMGINLLPELTSKTITMTGGLLAAGAAVIAQATTDTTVGTGSFLLGGAGLIAAISAFTKDYWTDRQKQREHEVALLRIKLRNCQTCNALLGLYNWAKSAHTSVAALPPVPELHFEDALDPDPATEKKNA
jgi:hypothetical protein